MQFDFPLVLKTTGSIGIPILWLSFICYLIFTKVYVRNKWSDYIFKEMLSENKNSLEIRVVASLIDQKHTSRLIKNTNLFFIWITLTVTAKMLIDLIYIDTGIIATNAVDPFSLFDLLMVATTALVLIFVFRYYDKQYQEVTFVIKDITRRLGLNCKLTPVSINEVSPKKIAEVFKIR